jgi:hypothetical protein
MGFRYLLLLLMATVVFALPFGVNAATVLPGSNTTTAFQNGHLVTYTYINNSCTPAVYNTSEARNASAVTVCEVGGPFGANITGATPIWSIIPSFAGLSVVAYPNQGTTYNGYPVYNGMVIVTQCGIGNSTNACPGKPGYFYSPVYSSVERALGVASGINGLPEGVFPNSARDFIMSSAKNATYTKSYLIRVNVYDPNIFPNATTGKCKVVAPSSLSNPTANCLTSVSALIAAINTTDSAIATINANNINWKTVNMPTKQAVILLINQTPYSSPVTYTLTDSANVYSPDTDQTGFSFAGSTNATPSFILFNSTTAAINASVGGTLHIKSPKGYNMTMVILPGTYANVSNTLLGTYNVTLSTFSTYNVATPPNHTAYTPKSAFLFQINHQILQHVVFVNKTGSPHPITFTVNHGTNWTSFSYLDEQANGTGYTQGYYGGQNHWVYNSISGVMSDTTIQKAQMHVYMLSPVSLANATNIVPTTSVATTTALTTVASTTVATTTVQPAVTPHTYSNTLVYAAIIVVIIIVVLAALMMRKKK